MVLSVEEATLKDVGIIETEEHSINFKTIKEVFIIPKSFVSRKRLFI